jgi:uncharacterized protein YjfI (DUF2170 family)
MPPLKKQNKIAVKDTRTPDEIAVQSAMTSHYNILTPMYKAQNIRIKNPLTTRDHLFSVNDPEFYNMFYELSQLGLKDKMMLEIETFAANIDPDWQAVYSALQGYFKAKESSNEIA